MGPLEGGFSSATIDMVVRQSVDTDWCGGHSLPLTQARQFGSYFGYNLEASVLFVAGAVNYSDDGGGEAGTVVDAVGETQAAGSGGGGGSQMKNLRGGGSGPAAATTSKRRGGALTALLNLGDGGVDGEDESPKEKSLAASIARIAEVLKGSKDTK